MEVALMPEARAELPRALALSPVASEALPMAVD